jgi:hypothetical protein
MKCLNAMAVTGFLEQEKEDMISVWDEHWIFTGPLVLYMPGAAWISPPFAVFLVQTRSSSLQPRFSRVTPHCIVAGGSAETVVRTSRSGSHLELSAVDCLAVRLEVTALSVQCPFDGIARLTLALDVVRMVVDTGPAAIGTPFGIATGYHHIVAIEETIILNQSQTRENGVWLMCASPDPAFNMGKKNSCSTVSIGGCVPATSIFMRRRRDWRAGFRSTNASLGVGTQIFLMRGQNAMALFGLTSIFRNCEASPGTRTSIYAVGNSVGLLRLASTTRNGCRLLAGR